MKAFRALFFLVFIFYGIFSCTNSNNVILGQWKAKGDFLENNKIYMEIRIDELYFQEYSYPLSDTSNWEVTTRKYQISNDTIFIYQESGEPYKKIRINQSIGIIKSASTDSMNLMLGDLNLHLTKMKDAYRIDSTLDEKMYENQK